MAYLGPNRNQRYTPSINTGTISYEVQRESRESRLRQKLNVEPPEPLPQTPFSGPYDMENAFTNTTAGNNLISSAPMVEITGGGVQDATDYIGDTIDLWAGYWNNFWNLPPLERANHAAAWGGTFYRLINQNRALSREWTAPSIATWLERAIPFVERLGPRLALGGALFDITQLSGSTPRIYGSPNPLDQDLARAMFTNQITYREARERQDQRNAAGERNLQAFYSASPDQEFVRYAVDNNIPEFLETNLLPPEQEEVHKKMLSNIFGYEVR